MTPNTPHDLEARERGSDISIPIRVLFFSFAADRVGAHQLAPAVPAGSTVADVFRRYERELGAPENRFMFAVNEVWAPRDRRLEAGDVVAIIPPVAGG